MADHRIQVEAAAPIRTDGPCVFVWWHWFVPAFFIILVLDQASKAWLFAQPISLTANAHFPGRVERLPAWIDRSYNPGVAWGIFGEWPSLVLCLTVIMVPVIAVVWWRAYRRIGRCENLAFAAILAGAIGNGLDRLAANLGSLYGVRDFLRIDLRPIGINYTWPTFNVADSAISVGFVLLAFLSFARSKPRSIEPNARSMV